MDDKIKKEIQSATFERLLSHLDERKDVQNIDLMNLAGFCRNCISKWYSEESKEKSDNKSDKSTAENMSEGSKSSGGKITAVTDSTSKSSSEDMLDVDANDRMYAFIPKINLKDVIIDYKTIMESYNNYYTPVTNHQKQHSIQIFLGSLPI